MKKKIIQTFLFILLSQIAIGQSNTTKMMIEYLKGDKFEIDSLKSILGISNRNQGGWEGEIQNELSVWNYFEREIEFETQQFILEYQDQVDFANYSVFIQHKEKKPSIIIVQVGYRESQLIMKRISDEAEKFFTNYNQKYQPNFKVKDIDEDFLEPFEFGYACSVGGSPTGKFREMMQAVKSKKVRKLRNWLASPNVNLRLFGAVGITWLQYGGRKIKKDEKKLIEALRAKNYRINACSGCSPETQTVTQLMDDEWLKNFYYEYQKRGWF